MSGAILGDFMNDKEEMDTLSLKTKDNRWVNVCFNDYVEDGESEPNNKTKMCLFIRKK